MGMLEELALEKINSIEAFERKDNQLRPWVYF